MKYWKFSQKTKLKQIFLQIVKKKWGIISKTGTIVLVYKQSSDVYLSGRNQ